MAKEIPYFRFTVQEWQNGDISLESYELKGLFIDVCGFYWVKDCSIDIALLEKRFKDARELLEQLISLDIIKVDNEGNVNINFLDDQFDLLSEKRQKRQEAGRKGGLSKSSNAKAMLKQNPSYKDKDNDKDKEKDKSDLTFPKESDAIEAIPPDSGKGRLLKVSSPNLEEEKPEDELTKRATHTIAEFFNISEQLNAKSYFEISRFVQHFSNTGNIDLLRTQFKAYKELKELDGCKHSWKNFIGDPRDKYQSGSWCEKTWTKELIEYKSKQAKFTGNGVKETPIVLQARRANRNPL